MNILVINGSSRDNSNTDSMLAVLLKNLSYCNIALRKYKVLPIHDQRHTRKNWETVEDDYSALIQKIVNADIVIFATPIYWYGISGLLKNFIDRWSQSLATNKNFKQDLKRKRIYLLLVGDDIPTVKGMPIIHQFQYICDFLNWNLVDYVIGSGNKPQEVKDDRMAMTKLLQLNQELLLGGSDE